MTVTLQQPLPGVVVAAEWVNHEDWLYEPVGSGQTDWPPPPVDEVDTMGRATAVTDDSGIARLSWSAPNVSVGVLLSCRKDGYNSLTRSPLAGIMDPRERGPIESPTLAPIADCVTLISNLQDADTGATVNDASIIDLLYWHYWRRRELWTVNADGGFQITINVRNTTETDVANPTVQAAGYPIQSGEWVDADGATLDLKSPELAGKTLEDVRLLIHKGVTIPGRLLHAQGGHQ